MDIKSETAKYGITPNKALGQNFLADDGAIAAILDSADIRGKSVLEIGAGLGSLTGGLKERCKRLCVVEIDSAMVDVLRSKFGNDTESFGIIHSDFLKTDYEQISDILGNEFSVVANLPYYITTPIVMRLLLCPYKVYSMTLMMQKEAAEHFTAHPGTKLYSPSAVLSGYIYNIEKVFELSPSSYYPMPDVNSVVLHFSDSDADRSIVPDLHKVLTFAFATRRKTLANNLVPLGFEKNEVAGLLASRGIGESARAEQLSVKDFIEITRIYRCKRQK